MTMDASGRVCIPKEVREMLGLSPGNKVVIESNGGDEIRLRPTAMKTGLPEKNISLVVLTDVDGNEAEDEITRDREARIQDASKEFSS